MIPITCIHMPCIAKRLIAGGAATAERIAIARLVLLAIRANQRNMTLHIQRAAHRKIGVLQNRNGRFKFRLKFRIRSGFIALHQSSRWTVTGRFYCFAAQMLVAGAFGQRPDVAVFPMTKTGIGAATVIQQIKCRPLDNLRTLIKGFAACGFSTLKRCFFMIAITKRRRPGLAATTKRILPIYLKGPALPVFTVVPFGYHKLLIEQNMAFHNIR